MSRIKKSMAALFTLLIMLLFMSVPVNAKRVHHHGVRISRRVRVNSKRHKQYKHHRKHKYRYKRYYYKRKKKVYRKKWHKRKHYKRPKRKRVVEPTPQFSKRDLDDINNDRQNNGLPTLNNDTSLQKIAIDRVTLAYKAWQNNWNSHGSDGKTATAAQLAFDSKSKDYNSNIMSISENNALSYISPVPITSSMVDGKMNYFPPEDVSTSDNIVDTNNDIYMNHDVGSDGNSGHRANILGSGVNSVGTAIYHKNGCYVQDEVFGYVY